MSYKIEFSAAAARALRKLTPDAQRRIAPAIDALADDPRHQGVKRLVGGWNEYRIRVGDYRVLYEIEDQTLVVLVVYIGHRREVYRRL
jgi:mRNA interferase RelE/StbE